MLYMLNGRQVVAEIKGSYSAPVIEMAYWAENDKDLTLAEVEAFAIECCEEIADAAYIYNNIRVLAGARREA